MKVGQWIKPIIINKKPGLSRLGFFYYIDLQYDIKRSTNFWIICT